MLVESDEECGSHPQSVAEHVLQSPKMWPRAEAKVDNRHDGFSKLHIVMYRCQDLPTVKPSLSFSMGKLFFSIPAMAGLALFVHLVTVPGEILRVD